MNYTEEQVKEILIKVWNDRVKGGGWDTRENFINHFKQVKKLNIDDVSNAFCKCVDATSYYTRVMNCRICNNCGEEVNDC